MDPIFRDVTSWGRKTDTRGAHLLKSYMPAGGERDTQILSRLAKGHPLAEARRKKEGTDSETRERTEGRGMSQALGSGRCVTWWGGFEQEANHASQDLWTSSAHEELTWTLL